MGTASGWLIVGCHNCVGGVSWPEIYHRWRGTVVPSAEHARLQVPQARRLSRSCQPGHDRPAGHATRGTAVVGELQIAAGLARQSGGVGEADFQPTCDTGAGVGGRRRTRRRCVIRRRGCGRRCPGRRGCGRRGCGRRCAGRGLARACGYAQPARRHGQEAKGDRAITDGGSGELAVGCRPCLRITDYVKPHIVSLHVSEACQPAAVGARRFGDRGSSLSPVPPGTSGRTSATVMVRAGQFGPDAGTSRSDTWTASRAPGAARLTWNTAARSPWPGGTVNQNSSVHPVRRYRAIGPNGPAESAIATKLEWLASARSVVRVVRHSGLRQTGVRTGTGMLSSTRTAVPATNPGPNQYWRGACAAPTETTVYATPTPNIIPLRAIARQVSASAPVSVAARHLMHPQLPGTCANTTYASTAQNTAPRVIRLAPPSTGYAPLHSSAPTRHSMAPAARPNSLH